MKSLFVIICFISMGSLAAQKGSLADLLWQEAGGRIDSSAANGGKYDIIDDAANGYLKVAFTEDGCGCYSETTAAAYKNKRGDYTSLNMYWNGCESEKKLSSNAVLMKILPKDFGLHSFLPKSKNTEYQITSAVFYLAAEIPRKGTDTKISLHYIPFGIHMTPKDHVLAYGYKQTVEHGGSNFLYSGALKASLKRISNENTLTCILEKTLDDIIPQDRKIVEKLYGKGKQYSGIDELASHIHQLKTIYEISKDMQYKSLILGWDRDKAQFFIKEKIENNAPKMSFLEFVRQLPFLIAAC